jgi:hypothetical protein
VTYVIKSQVMRHKGLRWPWLRLVAGVAGVPSLALVVGPKSCIRTLYPGFGGSA